MLEDFSTKKIHELTSAEGKNCERIIIPEISKNTMIRAKTEKGSIFFFEPQPINSQLMITGEYIKYLHGYFFTLLGKRMVNHRFTVGKSICFGEMSTPKINTLTILSVEDLALVHN